MLVGIVGNGHCKCDDNTYIKPKGKRARMIAMKSLGMNRK